MPYYPIVDMASIGPRSAGGGAGAELVTLRGDDEVVLPLFTSDTRFWAFVDRYFAEDDPLRLSTVSLDPLRLAEMIEPLGEAGALGSLIFNPIAVSQGQSRSAKEPIPVAHFCRFIAEIRPEIQRLNQESIEK